DPPVLERIGHQGQCQLYPIARLVAGRAAPGYGNVELACHRQKRHRNWAVKVGWGGGSVDPARMMRRHHIEFERFFVGIGNEPSVVEDDAAAIVGSSEKEAMVVVFRLWPLAVEPLPIGLVLLRRW